MTAMRLPTVTLRNNRSGEERILNYHDYIRQLGKYMTSWTVVSQSDVGATQEAVNQHLGELDGERKRFEKPNHISRTDGKRQQAHRSITMTARGAAAAAMRANINEHVRTLTKDADDQA